MSFETGSGWFGKNLSKGRRLQARQAAVHRATQDARRLGFEQLERRQLLTVVTVDTVFDVVDATDGLVSLREAITQTNGTPGPDTIEFASTLTSSAPATILLTAGELLITDALTIAGPGASLLTVDASGSDPTPNLHNGDGSRIFRIDDGLMTNHVDVMISGLTLTGGDVYSPTSFMRGGAILSAERLSLDHLIVTGNSAWSGGGIYAFGLYGNVVSISDCSISNNVAHGGGGLEIAGEANLIRLMVTSNEAIGGSGGGAYFSSNGDDPIIVSECVFSANRAGLSGGGISGGFLTVRDSSITGNHVGIDGSNLNAVGGGIAAGEQLILENNYIADNTAKDEGGGVHLGLAGNGDRAVTGNTILRNEAGLYGGGIYVRASPSGSVRTIANNTIADNSAQFGGGIRITGSAEFPVVNNLIENNHATSDGGGIWVSLEVHTLHFDGNTIRANLANGSGGGIWASNDDGILEIHNNKIDANTAVGDGGGVFLTNYRNDSSGLVAIELSQIINNQAGTGGGAAIASTSDDFEVDINSTSFEMNSATSGGGGLSIAASGGRVSLSGSTVAENDTTRSLADGGGIAIQNAGAELVISNSTISNNETQGGSGAGIYAFSLDGLTRIEHSTVAENHIRAGFGIGGGIFDAIGRLEIDHTLVSGNTDNLNIAYDLYSLSGTDVRHSLLGNNLGSGLATSPATAPDANGNIVGGVGVSVFVNLGALKDNGGPTRTRALQSGSAAIDAGDPAFSTPPASDQRGSPFERVFNGRIDIGAFERQLPTGVSLVVDSLDDQDNDIFSPGDLTLREAIRIANEDAVTIDTIIFAPELTANAPAEIVLTLGELPIRGPLIINGPGAELLTIDARGNDPTPEQKNGDGSRIFNIDDGLTSELIDVQIAGLTLTGGDSLIGGGAIYSRENLTIERSHLNGNSTSTGAIGGGAIFSEGPKFGPVSTLNVLDSTIADNTAGHAGGGGIGALFGSLTIQRSTISGNAAYVRGGGIAAYSLYGPALIQASTISGNSSNHSGGGIYLYTNSTTTIADAVVRHNHAGFTGGGIATDKGSLVITNTSIDNNTSERDGGGILSYNTALSVADSSITGNTAIVGGGGGISHSQPSSISATRVENTTISGNTAAQGGGISSAGDRLIVKFSTLTENTSPAGRGSGIAASGGVSKRIELYSTIIAANTNEDLQLVTGSISPFYSQGYNLIGTGNVLISFVEPGDQVGVTDPMLAPLANNGGPTLTHRLLSGSPALDAGDPDAAPGSNEVPQFDQRGVPFARVFGGQIDVGAFELQSPEIPGDFDGSGSVENADLTLLLNNWAQVTPPTPAGWIGTPPTTPAIDNDELTLLLNNWGKVAGSGATEELRAKELRVESQESKAASLIGGVDLDVLTQGSMHLQFVFDRPFHSRTAVVEPASALNTLSRPAAGATGGIWNDLLLLSIASPDSQDGVRESYLRRDRRVQTPTERAAVVDTAFEVIGMNSRLSLG